MPRHVPGALAQQLSRSGRGDLSVAAHRLEQRHAQGVRERPHGARVGDHLTRGRPPGGLSCCVVDGEWSREPGQASGVTGGRARWVSSRREEEQAGDQRPPGASRLHAWRPRSREVGVAQAVRDARLGDVPKLSDTVSGQYLNECGVGMHGASLGTSDNDKILVTRSLVNTRVRAWASRPCGT